MVHTFVVSSAGSVQQGPVLKEGQQLHDIQPAGTARTFGEATANRSASGAGGQ